MAARIVVLGDINQDFVMRAERMPRPGETLQGADLSFVPGGKGANQAVAAARLGAEVTAIGRIGDDPFGPRLREHLERENVVTDFVESDAHEATGSAFITLAPSGENSILVCMGANFSVSVRQIMDASEAIAQAEILLVQLGVPPEAVLHAMEIANEAGVPTLFDPSPVSNDLASLWPYTTIATPNETEAESITGMPVSTVEEAVQAASWLRERGVKIAIITLGAAGAVVLDDDGARHVRGYVVEVVDTTAAGDAFAGVLATRLAEGAPVDDALCFANAAGAIAASRFGAQTSLPTRDKIELLMAAQQEAERVRSL